MTGNKCRELCVLAFLGWLAGCSGSSPTVASFYPSAAPQIGRSPTGMTPSHYAKQDLLYVSDFKTGKLYVYSQLKKQPTLVQTLGSFSEPTGVCSDANGNVWLTSLAAGFGEILEYAHGRTKPIATLNNAYERSLDCSVDPTTGNLAVTNFSNDAGYQGSVSIFNGAAGSPTQYFDAAMQRVYYCGYDSFGNLYVDGENATGSVEVAELPKGRSTFTEITINANFFGPGGVKWDGSYLDVGSLEYQGSTIYRVALSGSSGKVIGTIPLSAGRDVGAYLIQKLGRVTTLITVAQGSGTSVPGEVDFYRYPKGGTPTKTIKGLSVPYGAAISVASGS